MKTVLTTHVSVDDPDLVVKQLHGQVQQHVPQELILHDEGGAPSSASVLKTFSQPKVGLGVWPSENIRLSLNITHP